MSRRPKPTRRVRVKIDLVLLLDTETLSLPLGGDFSDRVCRAIAKAAGESSASRGRRVLGWLSGGNINMGLDERPIDADGAECIARIDAVESVEASR